MDTKLLFDGGDRNFSLRSAILIYTDGAAAAATVHDITHAHGCPVIRPGRPVALDGLEELAVTLGKSAGTVWLPEQVVMLSAGKMAWWCPSGHRRIWFKPSHLDDSRKEEAAILASINGRKVWHPPLLFVTTYHRGQGSIHVYALLRDGRPQATADLYTAPYWNLNAGGMCNGNIQLPDAPSPDNIGAFEAAFFNSSFTHSSYGDRLTLHPGGHHGLWQELARRKTKPDAAYWRRVLVPAKTTASKVF